MGCAIEQGTWLDIKGAKVSVLKIHAAKSDALDRAIDIVLALNPDFVERAAGVVELDGPSSPMVASGEPHFVTMKIQLPDFDDQTLDKIMPLLQMLTSLIASQSSDTISAVLELSGPGGKTVDLIAKA